MEYNQKSLNMGNLRKKMAIGKAKIYYEIEDEFESVGTRFVNWDMYYTAAHAKGLWLCGYVANNTPVILGLIPWDNISRMIVDQKNERVYIEVNDFQSIMDDANLDLKMYKKSFTHPMSDSGKMAFSIPMELFSGNILYYLQEKIPTEVREEKLTDSEKLRSIIFNIIGIIAIVFIIASFFM